MRTGVRATSPAATTLKRLMVLCSCPAAGLSMKSTLARRSSSMVASTFRSGRVPAGTRPDLNVDATIELERLASVLFIESPAAGQEHSTISLFKVVAPGEIARTPVRIGRRSVQFVEVVEGLAEGDRVVLSDMSQYDVVDRLRLQ